MAYYSLSLNVKDCKWNLCNWKKSCYSISILLCTILMGSDTIRFHLNKSSSVLFFSILSNTSGNGHFKTVPKILINVSYSINGRAMFARRIIWTCQYNKSVCCRCSIAAWATCADVNVFVFTSLAFGLSPFPIGSMFLIKIDGVVRQDSVIHLHGAKRQMPIENSWKKWVSKFITYIDPIVQHLNKRFMMKTS